jgi:hypothetical protein
LSFEFVFQYPAWFLVFCLALGFLYAWLLYRKSTELKEAKTWMKRLVFGLRFVSVSLIAFLLLSPLIKLINRESEKPVILLLQDNSESISQVKDSAFYTNEYPGLIEQLRSQLEESYEFRSYSFDDQLNDSFRLNYSGKETDISEALSEINNLYLNRNVGAVILATDGIYNKGTNPLYTVNELKAPVYTIAMGDTTLQRDLLISRINHNQLAYLNNTFPVEVVVNANKLSGKTSVLKLERDGVVLATQTVSISSSTNVQTFPFQLKADKPGIQRYKVTLSAVDGEYTLANNSRDFFIEVIDSRQKVLILADAPHPDVAAIRLSLQSNENYEVEVKLANAFSGTVKGYSLVILHQLPSKSNLAQRIIQELDASNTPTWFIAGNATLTGLLNPVQPLVQFSGGKGAMNESLPRANKDFALFTMSDELRKAFNTFEPLQVPYAAYRVQASAATMLRQRIGTVDTDFPLFVFSSDADRKTAILLGEGIWRWRLHDFLEHENHSLFDEFISKTVQYLSVRNERRNFRIVAKNSFNENEPVTFEGEVYNASYELINTPDVLINIFDEANRRYAYSMSRTTTAYTLNAGMMRSGNYRYEASVNVGGKNYTATGRFVVKPVLAELSSITADHVLLQTLASRNGGEQFLPRDLLKLVDKIKAREDVKPLSRSEIKLRELVQLKWIFFLILILLGTEWFLRRRNGSY